MSDKKQECLINLVISDICGREVSWYEGKMELEVIPRIVERLEEHGVHTDHETIEKRIEHLNLQHMENSKHLVLVFSDQTKFKIPSDKLEELLRNQLAGDLVANYDIDFSVPRQQVDRECPLITDDQLIGYSQVMEWDKIKQHATQLSEEWPAVNYQAELPYCQKEIMTDSEIDRYKINAHINGQAKAFTNDNGSGIMNPL